MTTELRGAFHRSHFTLKSSPAREALEGYQLGGTASHRRGNAVEEELGYSHAKMPPNPNTDITGQARPPERKEAF